MARPFLPLLLFLAAGCQLTQELQQDPRTHDERLRELVNELESVRAGEGDNLGRRERVIRSELNRLYYEDPTHVDTAWVLGVLAADDRDPDRATFYLDTALAREPSHARAAEARVRIALELGNLEYANRVLETSMALSPDDPGLHEAKALALYLEQKWKESSDHLREAERLGAPLARVAFNRGLIAEARGNLSEAMSHYRTAIEESGGVYPRAEQRLIGVGGTR